MSVKRDAGVLMGKKWEINCGIKVQEEHRRINRLTFLLYKILNEHVASGMENIVIFSKISKISDIFDIYPIYITVL